MSPRKGLFAMRMKKCLILVWTGLASIVLSGCGSPYATRVEYEYPSNRYSYREQSDYRHDCPSCGTVREVFRVKSKDKHLGAGTAIGAIAGGALGSTVGKGDGRDAATIAGALIGGAIGHKEEKKHRDERYAWRFRVKMDDGRLVTVTQPDNPDIREGDRVLFVDNHIEPM